MNLTLQRSPRFRRPPNPGSESTYLLRITVQMNGATSLGGGVGLVFPCGGGLVHGGADDP
jgi:hypothetical protein